MGSASANLSGSGPQQIYVECQRKSQNAAGNYTTYHCEVRYYGNGYGSWSASPQYWSASFGGNYREGSWIITQGSAFDTYTVLYAADINFSHNSAGVLAAFNVTATIDTNHSAIGDGTASYTEPSPPALKSAPAKVTGLTLSAFTPTGMKATWNIPSNGGSAITGYILHWSPSATFAPFTAVNLPPSQATVIAGMAPNTLYYVRILAVNANGNGAWSDVKQGNTLPATAPTILPVSSASGSSTTVSFLPPNGTSGVDEYWWERWDESLPTNNLVTGKTPLSTITVPDAIPGRVYKWRAAAFFRTGAYLTIYSNWVALAQAKPNTGPGDYFDGSTVPPAGSDVTFGWGANGAGAAHASISIAQALAPEGWEVVLTGGSASLARVTSDRYASYAARVTFNADVQVAGSRMGQQGADPYWTAVTAGVTYAGAIECFLSRQQTVAAELTWYNAAGGVISRTLGTPSAVPGSVWSRLVVGGDSPTGAVHAAVHLIDVVDANWRIWQGGDTATLDGAMISLNDLYPYFDGSTLFDGTYVYDWTGTPNASTSTRTPIDEASPAILAGLEDSLRLLDTAQLAAPGGLALIDPDCAVVPGPPRPPTIPTSCITESGVWRRYFSEIPPEYVSDYLDVVPTFEIVTRSANVRQVRIRIYANPDALPISQVPTTSWISEQIVSYVPKNTVMTLDGVSQRAYAEVNGAGAVSADHLLYGSNGGTPVWPVLSCGIGYVLSVDIPLEIAQADSRLFTYLTTRY